VLRALGTRALARLPVALLVAVAAHHFWLVHARGLHPWLGGGFGMFSTVDERSVLALRVAGAGEERLEIPDDLEDAADRCEALPEPARLQALAAELAALPEHAGAAVRVEVLEARFDAELRPAWRLLGSAVADGNRAAD
jgi:hypothetical protein